MWSRRHPREGKDRSATWNTETVDPGTRFNAHLAGEVQWVEVHATRPSKPCVKLLTDDRLECPYCRIPKPRPISWLGYVPLYDSMDRRIVVMVKDHQAPTLDKLRLHQAVKVSREKQGGSPVCVIASDWSGDYQPTSVSRRDSADIRAWLVVLWALPELREHYGISAAPTQGETKPVPAGEETLKELIDKTTLAQQEADAGTRELIRRREEWFKRRGHLSDPIALSEVIPPIVKMPSRNGKHPPAE